MGVGEEAGIIVLPTDCSVAVAEGEEVVIAAFVEIAGTGVAVEVSSVPEQLVTENDRPITHTHKTLFIIHQNSSTGADNHLPGLTFRWPVSTRIIATVSGQHNSVQA
jgi:hypothetical protein